MVGIAIWFLDKPHPQIAEREKSCRAWGVTDAATLTKCGESEEQAAAIIAPLKRATVDREIADFNKELSSLSARQTRALRTDYASESIEKIAQLPGTGMLGLMSWKEGAQFPAKGERVSVTGFVVTNVPDLNDDPDDRTWQPRYFTIMSLQPPAKDTIPTEVNLDIESLNRYEREFIIEHCGNPMFTMTPCRATALGHLDEIVGRSDQLWTYFGIVADQVDIQPVTRDTANADGIPSFRSMVRSSFDRPPSPTK